MPRRWFAAAALTLLALAPPAWTEEGEDALRLHTGERVPCRIEAERDGFVVARIGSRTYRIERESLQGAERGGVALPDETTVRFVERLAPHLVGGNERLKQAATAALRALGDVPAVEVAAKRARDPRVAAALRALGGGDK